MSKVTNLSKSRVSSRNVISLKEKPTALAAHAIAGTSPRTIKYDTKAMQKTNNSWDRLMELSNEIGQQVANLASDVDISVKLVQQFGCKHVAEFNVAVNKTNTDFLKFIDDFNKIKQRHLHKTGSFVDENDTALGLSIYEEYMQFRAYFDGVMHHSLISFTEYALEAKDIYKEKMAQQEAAEKNEAEAGASSEQEQSEGNPHVN